MGFMEKKCCKNFEPMTLTMLLLPFYKTHLNQLKYEKKPPDTESSTQQAVVAGKVGDPTSR